MLRTRDSEDGWASSIANVHLRVTTKRRTTKHTCTVGAEFAKQLSGFGLEQMSTVLRLGRKLRILREPLNQVLLGGSGGLTK